MIACTMVILPAPRRSAPDSNGRSEERVDEDASEASHGRAVEATFGVRIDNRQTDWVGTTNRRNPENPVLKATLLLTSTLVVTVTGVLVSALPSVQAHFADVPNGAFWVTRDRLRALAGRLPLELPLLDIGTYEVEPAPGVHGPAVILTEKEELTSSSTTCLHLGAAATDRALRTG